MDLVVKTLDGQDAGSLAVSESVFGLEPRADLLHRVVRWQLARRQQGTHQAQTRGEVARTGSKMYKQKGTGRARHSSARVSQFRGGAKAHGPQARSHAHDLPKKIRALGLKHALSAKLRSDALLVIDELNVGEAKTRILSKQLAALGLDNVLVIGGNEGHDNFSRAAANIPNVDVLPVQGINVYDIMRRSKLVLSKEAVASLEERFK